MASVFYTLLDKAYTGYFSNVRLNEIFNEAQSNVIERKYAEYQKNRKIPDELLGLVEQDNTSYQNINSTSASLPNDYYHYLAGEVTYEIDGEELTVTPYAATDDMRFVKDPYNQPSVLSPVIRISDQIYFEPTDVSVKDFVLVYLKQGNDIDVSKTNTSPIYSEKLQYLVIREAYNIATQILRDQFGYKTSEAEIQQNP